MRSGWYENDMDEDGEAAAAGVFAGVATWILVVGFVVSAISLGMMISGWIYFGKLTHLYNDFSKLGGIPSKFGSLKGMWIASMVLCIVGTLSIFGVAALPWMGIATFIWFIPPVAMGRYVLNHKSEYVTNA